VLTRYTVIKRPTWELLSVIVNCEYQIYVLYENIPLRKCPFLSHWVETAQLVCVQLQVEEQHPNREYRLTTKSNRPTSYQILIARLELITRILRANNRSEIDALGLTPRLLCLRQASLELDVEPYIRMLEEEEIWDSPTTPTDKQTEATKSPVKKTNGTVSNSISRSHDPPHWQSEIMHLLATDRQHGITRLKQLPLELRSLDFLTHLLEAETLISFSIDPSPVIREYLLHCLRIVERMAEPPSADDMNTETANGNGHSSDSEVPDDYGRPAQERAVQLLVLFIRNLINKGLVPLQDICYEIQEICIRYIFIKEAREFRAFVWGDLTGM
jgi:hypothetical protein